MQVTLRKKKTFVAYSFTVEALAKVSLLFLLALQVKRKEKKKEKKREKKEEKKAVIKVTMQISRPSQTSRKTQNVLLT